MRIIEIDVDDGMIITNDDLASRLSVMLNAVLFRDFYEELKKEEEFEK